jgi:HSP20 family protein
MASTRQQSGESIRTSEHGGQSSREMQRRDQRDIDQRERALQRRQQFGPGLISPFGFGPFSLIRRMQEDIDRMFSGGLFGQGGSESGHAIAGFEPAVETFQRGNEFVIRADLPGVDQDTVEVDVNDDAISIRGERRIEREDEREGLYVSEVAYGRFQRVVPLPTGAVADDAAARLNNGVLEIVVPAPSEEARRGRRLNIQRTGELRGGEQRSGEKAESAHRRS